MPRLSIITPVFNGIDYISDCIENVRSQDVSDLEHLVIDGGSTDGTVERISELAKLYPHIRFVSEKDRGQSDAMNKGIRLARGEVVGILNVDDFYEPGAVSEALSFLATNPNVDFVVGDYRTVGQKGSQVSINRPRDLRLESLLLGWEYAQYPGNPSAYFYKKNVHSIVGEYDVRDHYAMDFTFILACTARVKMAYVPRLWGNFRFIPGTKTFDDKNGAARRREIRNRWINDLSRTRYLHMRMIAVQKHAAQGACRIHQALGKRIRNLLSGSSPA